MLLFLKKNAEEPETPEEGEEAGRPPLSEFIPYYCHYDPHTLLTKNGELMQTIRIDATRQGTDYESGEDGQPTVRDILRQAIAAAVKSDAIALWIHTLRKREPIHFPEAAGEDFAAYMHNHWQQKFRWNYRYHNEIYVTFLHEGRTSPLFDKKVLKQVMLPRRNRRHYNHYLTNAYATLNATVTQALEHIGKHYQTRRLALAERPPQPGSAPIFYSEPMEFLGQLLNLRDHAFPLPEAGISEALITTQPTFGFNALETKNDAGKRRFGAMLIVKQYQSIPPETADRILQSPMEFIISEAFNFLPAEKALKLHREQKLMFDISGDRYSIQSSGIEEMLKNNHQQPTDFGEHQTSITILADHYRQLDEEVAKVQNAFSEIGLVTIREDLKLEECFWAQLPGNFEFLRRRHAIAAPMLAGFCRLNRFPVGTPKDGRWGEYATLIPTKVRSPYFFHFHRQDNGHTTLFDFDSFGDHLGRVLVNFLLVEARKFGGRVFIFDRQRSARLLFDKLGGQYHSLPLPPSRGKLRLNPFTLEDTPRNQAFLAAWCGTLLPEEQGLDDQQKGLLQAAIAQLYAQPPEHRHLPGLIEQLMPLSAPLAQAFSPWHGRGMHAGLFDSPQENLSLENPWQAFDMTAAAEHPAGLTPLMAYLMHRTITALDGKPAVIVLHEGWELVNNAFFAPRLESLLEMLKQHNAMVLFTTRKPMEFIASPVAETLMNVCATRLYLPDDIRRDYAPDATGLSEANAALLRKMERQEGEFLVKQGGESVALRVDLRDLDDIRAILDNDVKNLMAAGGPFASLPKSDE